MYRRARLGIGYLPQEASIFRGLTVEQNIRAVLEIGRARRAGAAREQLDELLGEFSHHPSAPRAGDRAVGRRAAARRDRARAGRRSPTSCCSTSPSPASTRSRSPTSATWCAHLKDRGIGVLITDHNVRETLEIVDRAYILHDGRC